MFFHVLMRVSTVAQHDQAGRVQGFKGSVRSSKVLNLQAEP